jgi:hypothetical protein
MEDPHQVVDHGRDSDALRKVIDEGLVAVPVDLRAAAPAFPAVEPFGPSVCEMLIPVSLEGVRHGADVQRDGGDARDEKLACRSPAPRVGYNSSAGEVSTPEETGPADSMPQALPNFSAGTNVSADPAHHPF